MSWNVVITFRTPDSSRTIPDEETILPTLPQRDDVIWTTPKYLELGDSDQMSDAFSWRVVRVDMYLLAHQSKALIMVEPYRG